MTGPPITIRFRLQVRGKQEITVDPDEAAALDINHIKDLILESCRFDIEPDEDDLAQLELAGMLTRSEGNQGESPSSDEDLRALFGLDKPSWEG